MKKVLILFLILAPIVKGQTKTFTLEESIKQGIKNNTALKISYARVKEAEAKKSEAASRLLPKLSLKASYAHLSNVPPFEVSLPVMPAPVKIQDAVLNTYSIGASLAQPVFAGHRLTSLNDAAEFSSKAVSAELLSELNNTAHGISLAFWNYYRSEKFLRLAEQGLKRAEQHLLDTKNYLDNGLVTRSDYLKIEVLYSGAKLAVIEAENNRKLSMAVFNRSMGLNLNEDVVVSGYDPSVNLNTYDFEKLLEEGLNNRNEIKSSGYMLEASNEFVGAANSGWYPTLSIFGNIYYQNPNQRYLPLKDEFRDSWDVGVALDWNIWDWGETASKTAQAEQRLVQAETALELIKERVHLEIYSAFLNLKKEYDKVMVNESGYIQAGENLEIVKNLYGVQMASSADLIDAETTYLETETRLISSKIDFEIGRLNLDKSIGRKLY